MKVRFQIWSLNRMSLTSAQGRDPMDVDQEFKSATRDSSGSIYDGVNEADGTGDARSISKPSQTSSDAKLKGSNQKVEIHSRDL